MSATPIPNWQYLAPNPKSAYRQLFLKGTRIRAEIIYGLTVDGSEPMTPEEVADSYGLTLAAVYEACAYCLSAPREIELDHLAEEKIMAATGMNDPDYRLGGKYRIISPQQRAQLAIEVATISSAI